MLNEVEVTVLGMSRLLAHLFDLRHNISLFRTVGVRGLPTKPFWTENCRTLRYSRAVFNRPIRTSRKKMTTMCKNDAWRASQSIVTISAIL